LYNLNCAVILPLRMNSTNKIRALIIFPILFLNINPIFSQNLNALYDLVVGKSKDLDKALNDISAAGKLTQEANNYYNEAQQLQSNFDLDEKTLQKQLAKTEEKALTQQIKADKLFTAAYKSLNNICLNELKNSKVAYGEIETYTSTSKDLMTQAARKRKDATAATNPYEMGTLLNDAAGLESVAIENLITALQVQKGQVPEVSAQDESVAEPEDYTPIKSVQDGSVAEPEDYTPISSVQDESVTEPEDYTPISSVQEETVTEPEDYTPINSVQDETATEPEEYTPINSVQEEVYQPAVMESSSTYDVTQKSENLSVDQSVINKYQEYINDSSVPDPITINRDGVTGVSDTSVESAREVFFAMQTGNEPVYASPAKYGVDEQQAAIADSITQIAQSTATEAEIGQTITDKSANQEVVAKNTLAGNQGSLIEQPAKEKQTSREEYKTKREYVDLSYSQQSTGIRFMVQIAASRTPLSRSQLWAIYPGNLSVEVMNEDGWYKYRIVNFRIFSEANRVALESGVNSAWVLSILDGKPLSLVDAREMTRVLEADVKRYGDKAIKDAIDYYVQTSASRIRMNDSERESLCGAWGGCREILEGGWFKYQLYAGTDYYKAVELKNRFNGKSFIVAYKRGTKIQLNKAMNNQK
jgi:hypothetical protein